MCGIAGAVDSKINKDQLAKAIKLVIAHRGPDAGTHIIFNDVLLVHRRLAIIDLNTGDQPIYNHDRSKCIIYNGELYNYKEIRSRLLVQGVSFTTNSDTEVILKAYEKMGPAAFQEFNGIFAFVIYDIKSNELIIVRDQFGIKPMHYYFDGNVFVFGSEQKAILEHPSVPRRLNKQALHYHLNLRYTQGNETLFEGIKRLPPAHYLKYKNGNLSITKYWELKADINPTLTENEGKEQFNFLLKQAVERQLLSDVPVGVYLSGGLDSSAIVQKMHELDVPIIRTYTMGFNEPTDEFPDARLVAQKFNTDHHELSLSMNPLEDMEQVIWHAEEPKINLLQGYNMSKFVSEHVKVVLGGLGGDELMGGYDIHRFIYPVNKLHSAVPEFIIKLLRWKATFLFKIQNFSGTLKWDEYRRGCQMLLAIGDIERYYLILRNVWDYDDGFYSNIYNPKFIRENKNQLNKSNTEFERLFQQANKHNALDQVFMVEMHSKMLNDYLLVEDRMSMAHSVEERVPFLDLDLVQFCATIPVGLKMKHGQTKYLFRKAMEGKLPEQIIRKKKWGFTVNPYLQFKKDLKEKAEKELTRSFVEKQGIFNYDYIQKIIHAPAHPRMRWHYNYLWLLLGLKVWQERFEISE